MSAWRDLPNAAHIDRIIESLKTRPHIWAREFDAAWSVARATAWSVARAAARVAAWDAARDAVRDEVREEAWPAARNEILDAAWFSIAALIAWDDSDRFLDMTSDELIVWIRLSSDPAAALMLPAVRVFERIKSLETV